MRLTMRFTNITQNINNATNSVFLGTYAIFDLSTADSISRDEYEVMTDFVTKNVSRDFA